MIDVAKYVRVFEKDPSDEFVQKRITVVSSMVEKFSKLSAVADILGLAHDTATSLSSGGSMPEQRTAEIETLIKSESTSFVREEQQLQILTCALMAELEMMTAATPSGGHWNRREVLGVGLWSALSVQPPRSESRLESLRSDLLGVCQKFINRASVEARKRVPVPDVPAKAKDNSTPIELADVVKASNKVMDALRINAALDREELDLLWWCIADWSSLLGARFSDLPSAPAAIAAGIEAGSLMRRLPAESHQQLVQRYVKEKVSLDLNELLDQLGTYRAKLVESFGGNSLLESCSAVFPLMAGLCEQVGGGQRHNVKFPLSDWASRSLLESSMLRVSSLSLALV
jgi:hypothetical protein